jgi:hypothetical protein
MLAFQAELVSFVHLSRVVYGSRDGSAFDRVAKPERERHSPFKLKIRSLTSPVHFVILNPRS